MTTLKHKLKWWVMPIFLLTLVYQMLLTEAYMKSVRIEEIPFGLSEADKNRNNKLPKHSSGIYAGKILEQTRSFFHLFNVPYIVCFFAAKGKWPFIPPMMQVRVDSAAKTIFSRNDSYIKQFCQKWIAIKECFRPIFGSVTTPINLEVERYKECNCEDSKVPVVYFDKNYIGNVSSDTIRNTIEFLESFLPTPTKKPKKRNRVRGRIDEIDID